ncbi:MAG: aminopeptidase P family protein [Chloroflexi bacterium]|nr:aminopeptidase P family protein [Chloroflexota bacterium]
MRKPANLYFSLDEYRQRLDGVRARMAERGVDVLLLHTPENIYYLSGYQTPGYYWYMALVVPTDREPVLIPPPHEESLVPAYSIFDSYVTYRDNADWVATTANVLRDLGCERKRIGYEQMSWFFRVGEYERLKAFLPDATLVSASGTVEQRRMIKSPEEIEYMRRAAAAAEAGIRAGIEAARVGATENDVAAEVVRAQLAHNSEYSGLPPFITSGPRSMLVHATWSGRELQRDEIVFLEVPGCINRYHAAMTRSVWLGDPPDLLLRANETNTEALRLAKEAIRPGAAAHVAFEIARDRITAGNVGYRQGRRIAYSIGIAFPPGWDEGHIISINDGETRAFQPGMTFHLITTMRIAGIGAVGCSDTVMVASKGCETLTAVIPAGVVITR